MFERGVLASYSLCAYYIVELEVGCAERVGFGIPFIGFFHAYVYVAGLEAQVPAAFSMLMTQGLGREGEAPSHASW